MTVAEGLTLRGLEERDLDAFARDLRMSQHHINDRWREAQAGKRTTLIADLDGRAVGCVSFDERGSNPGRLHLYALGVAPDLRRRGIGTKLVQAVESEAQARGLAGMHLAVDVTNDEAIALYDSRNYTRVGEPYTSRWTWYGPDGEEREVVERCVQMVKDTTPQTAGSRNRSERSL